MNEDILGEDELGQWVDAWLTGLRAQGLSERRLRELAGLLGQAMSAEGPQTPAQARVLRRFEAWRRAPR
jgi:hypothetical protein